MNNGRVKINVLTKIKMSLGIDTKADEINMQLNTLQQEKNKIAEKMETTSIKLSDIESIINNIDNIYSIAETDIKLGNAEDLSIKIMSYQLSIERAKKVNEDISKIVEMEQNVVKLLEDTVKEYINNIIMGFEYPNGDYKKIKILMKDILHTLNRLKVNNINLISNSYDLDKIKEYMMDKSLSLSGKKEDYLKNHNSLHKKIFEIEISEEKKLADDAVELAKSKKKR